MKNKDHIISLEFCKDHFKYQHDGSSTNISPSLGLGFRPGEHDRRRGMHLILLAKYYLPRSMLGFLSRRVFSGAPSPLCKNALRGIFVNFKKKLATSTRGSIPPPMGWNLWSEWSEMIFYFGMTAEYEPYNCAEYFHLQRTTIKFE